MQCPLCSSGSTGQVGTDQYYCWNCLVEFDTNNQVYQVAEDGTLEAYDPSGMGQEQELQSQTAELI